MMNSFECHQRKMGSFQAYLKMQSSDWNFGISFSKRINYLEQRKCGQDAVIFGDSDNLI